MRIRLAVSLALSAAPALSFAQTSPALPGSTPIAVAASHTIRVAADRATLFFLVEGTAETSDLARRRLEEKVYSVRKAIGESGLAAEPPTDVVYAIAPTTNNSGNQWPAGTMPFTARSAVRVQMRRLDQVASMTAAALTAGATAIAAPQYEFTGADSLRASAISIALRRARHDAEAVARGLNGTLGEPLEVSVFGANSSPNQPILYFISRFDSSSPATLPEVNVTATVNVRYQFVPRR